MSVVIDAVSVIVQVRTINEKYRGGIAQYQADCPNRTFACDGLLARVAFMTGADAHYFVDRLEQRGLVRQRDGIAVDIGTVEQFVNLPDPPCPWLTVAVHPERYTFAWLTGTEPGVLAHHVGWTPALSASMIRVPAEESSERILPLTPKGPLQEILDYKTGQINFVGNAFAGTNRIPRISTDSAADLPKKPKKVD